MNYFNDEEKIIQIFQMSSLQRICFVNCSVALFRFFSSLYFMNGYKHWINNSANTLEPPDYINNKAKLMLEVMRVDDYEKTYNHPNAVESRIYNELERSMVENHKTLKEVEVLINPFGTEVSKNNLKLYFSNFSRIVNKHAEKAKAYRENHPGYKLGFLIFDESPAYAETQTKIAFRPKQGMPIGLARYYQAPYDDGFINILLNTDVDYVAWMTPNKMMPENPSQTLKQAYMFDVKKAKRKPIKAIKYKYDNIICLEAESV